MGARDADGNPEGMPWEYYRWHLAEKFGWSLDTVDSLSMGDIGEWFQIEDARTKVRDAYEQQKRR